MSELINNREHRIETMKTVIRHLHAGKPADEVRGMLRDLVRETDATEIAAMEQSLIGDGMQIEEVKSMCDLHSAVLREVMVERQEAVLVPGHPVHTFRAENDALRGVIGRMREIQQRIVDSPDDAPVDAQLIASWRGAANELADVEKHYARKENLLFSFLEGHGITGPSKVMWAKDDDVRALVKNLHEALRAGEATLAEWKLVVWGVAEPTLAAMEEMFFKEENILFPLSMSTLTDDEWGQVYAQSPEYGWCLVAPESGYTPPEPKHPDQVHQVPAGKSITFPSGHLTFEQLLGLFIALPVDLTFVDADDRVRFFSEGPDRVFARSRAIIGRLVQHCHPPKSVDMVERILHDFKSGTQSVAEFWIEMHGKFVHIRYFAVRDEKGAYQGTLEVTQDLTRLRALTGERRLLQYDSAPAGSPS
ncbi:MAG: DUF438 domain-containing protein [Deltaproteobacteria bacterium]|nr:DUF438 domain-containing protein [Deltaproteobacteria bacterium]